LAYEENLEDMLLALKWIESHLKEDITLESAARHVSLSKFHFHRLFHRHIGMPFAGYIRQRRLASSAGELIATDRKILDIALNYFFESQASFTRAFKRAYQMSPGQYRRYFGRFISRMDRQIEEDNIMNKQTKDPIGWILAGSHPGDYEKSIDLVNVHQGRASGRLQSRAEAPEGFGTMMQTFHAKNYRDKRYELSAFIQTENVTGWCGLWMRVDGKDEEVLQFDNMGDRSITGSQQWHKYHVVLDIPAESEAIAFGVLLMGEGKVWVDSIRFDEVSRDVPSTNMEEQALLPDQPINLDFEEIDNQLE
jgi:AraC-like DNA-binding protein